MKFSTQFFGLVASSFVALTAGKTVQFSQKDSFNEILTEECRKEVANNKLFDKCIFEEFTVSNIKEVCGSKYSDECNKFDQDIMSQLPKCANDPNMKKLAEYVKDSYAIYKNYYCTVTSDGKTCPSVLKIIESNEKKQDPGEYHKLDCDYQSCIDVQLKAQEMNKKYVQLNNDLFIRSKDYNVEVNTKYFNDIIEYLKSPQCAPKNKDAGKLITDAPSSTSGATSIKVLSSFLSLALLYVLF